MNRVDALLDRARAGDERAFAELVSGHRRELTIHCYRMLGSMDDADDAMQETFLAAWRGLVRFEERASLRAWLYRIATNVSLRMSARRPARMLSWEQGPARDPLGDLGAPLADVSWVQPWIAGQDDPADLYARRETIELAWIAALQYLPPNQRAVLILRDVLDFSAAETALALDTSVASVTSALQRARSTLSERAPQKSQQFERRDTGSGVVDAFVDAFERADIPALLALLTADVRFTMPPLGAWFQGLTDVATFLEHRSLITPWRVEARLEVNGQPGLLARQFHDGNWRPGALMVLNFSNGRINWIASFLDPASFSRANR